VTGLDASQEYSGNKWWQLGMEDFTEQVRQHCHHCGIPMRGYGQLSQAPESEREQTSLVHLGIYSPKRNMQIVQVVDESNMATDFRPQTLTKVTDYVNNGRKS